MKRGRPTKALELTAEESDELRQLVNAGTTPQALAQRCRIVLLAAEGCSGKAIAEELGVSVQMVSKWRQRFLSEGLAGLLDVWRPGRPRTHSDEELTRLIERTLQPPPSGKTQWSVRQLATETDVSKSTIHRLWQAACLKPHRQRSFRLSNDPFFTQKVRDIVGLYLEPPCNAMVLCVDEKSQCQALERAQPGLPLGLGYLEGYTSDYVRHGTTTLFAAFDIATGEVIAQCRKRHRHQEFLSFLKLVDRNTPAGLDLHLVMDNYGSHKHQKVRLYLAEHPRIHVHFTPTHASWLNQVEIFFNIITRQAIRRGSFRSTDELKAKIAAYIEQYNQTAKPFSWVATADSILGKLTRLMKRISGT